jgi:predicted ATP-dependent protease
MRPQPLSREQLRWKCPLAAFDFKSTNDLEPTEKIVGQDRAVLAVRLGLEIPSIGYNMFVTGVSGTGRETTVKRILDSLDLSTTSLRDIVYVHNFEDASRPLALLFSSEDGQKFVDDLRQCVDLLKANIPAVVASEKMSVERRALANQFKARQQEAMQHLDVLAKEKGFTVVSIPVAPDQFRPDVLPVIDGQTVSFEHLEELQKEGKLTEEDAKRFTDTHEELFIKLTEAFRKTRKLELEAQEAVKELHRRLLKPTVEGILDRLKENAEEKVVAYADSLVATIFDNLEDFVGPGPDEDPYYLFTANLLVDNSRSEGRPVIIEHFPDATSLFGTIERIVVENKPYSDFTMIRAGSLLKADGGYLIMDAMDVIRQPGLWQALMQTLRNQTVVIRQHDPFGLFPVELQPEPIEINMKVILLGSAYLYSLLGANDPEFGLLFRIRADFDDVMELNEANLRDFAEVIGYIAQSEKLPPLTGDAMGALAEQAVRLTERRDRISTEFSRIADYARQAAYWARQESAAAIEARHVERAIIEKRRRLSMSEDYALESIAKGELMIDISGSQVGQVNGLVVISTVDYSFGLPIRVSARVSPGREGLINIEREADLSGSLHTKGVLIINGILRGRYARDYPLSLSASLCIEQSYGGVEGDSASCAELYAILSSLSGLPLRQDLAVTGSVNQFGEVQPIGGVNQKIEGFFRVCSAKGLTGTQGVLIPASNIEHLQLDEEVVAAVEKGMFWTYPVSSIDEGMELLTGVQAGDLLADGTYPEGSVNFLVESRLREMASILRTFGRGE